MKEVSPFLAGSDAGLRNAALKAIAEALNNNKEAVFAANRVDLDNAKANGLAAPVIKRLIFNESKLEGGSPVPSVLSGLFSKRVPMRWYKFRPCALKAATAPF